MKLSVKKAFLYTFFLLNTVKEIMPSMSIPSAIKQYPKTIYGLGFICLTGFSKLVSFVHAHHLEKKYNFLHVQCIHNTNNTGEDFNNLGKQCKKYPNKYNNNQYSMLLNCMKGKVKDLNNFNECNKAINIITGKTKKDDVPFTIQKYVK